MKRSLLTLNDLSTDHFFKILESIKQLKQQLKARELVKIMENKVVGLLFNQPSTRTRTSFETAIKRLGGETVYLSDLRLKRDELVHPSNGSEQIDLRYVEPIRDTARMLGSYLDCLIIRTRNHAMIEEIKHYSGIPVINANSDKEHPTQIISDLFTILELKGSFSGLNLTYLGDGNNTCCSLLMGCAHAGINMIAACPIEAQPDKETFERAQEIAKKTGANLKMMDSPEEAVKEADILYTDAWISMSDKRGKEGLFKIFGKYQINSQLLSLAKKETVVMHCLPAHRDIEITNEVLEGPQSIVWQQGENKIYTAAAVMADLCSKTE